MQAQAIPSPRRRSSANNASLGRAVKYLGRYRNVAAIAYLSLFISTLAQLAVPQLVQSTIDAITRGVAMSAAKATIPVQTSRADVEAWLIAAGVGVVGFAVMRGIFAFSQSYNAERTSQGVAFDLRNELFAKIQRLSFSYHDQAQTGQLMIRATDDVEKVRLFVGQGLMMALQALFFLIGTLLLLSFTNLNLTLVVLPTLPIALILFMGFGAISQPLFMQVQILLSRLNTILQENLAGIRVVKAFVREASEQTKFNASAESLMQQQLVVARLFSFLMPFIFFDCEPGSSRRAVLWRSANPRGNVDARRVAKILAPAHLPFLPDGDARHDHYANVASHGFRHAYL